MSVPPYEATIKPRHSAFLNRRDLRNHDSHVALHRVRPRNGETIHALIARSGKFEGTAKIYGIYKRKNIDRLRSIARITAPQQQWPVHLNGVTTELVRHRPPEASFKKLGPSERGPGE